MNHLAPSPVSDDRHLNQLTRAFAANAALYDREARFPADNIDQLRQAGLLALTVPSRFGGVGGGLSDTTRVLGRVAEGCASTALILALQLFKHAALARSDLWSQSVQARIAAEAVEDGALINALRVEPELGSPSRGGMPATTLSRTPRGWALTGHKIFATGAPRAADLADRPPGGKASGSSSHPETVPLPRRQTAKAK
jgi:alkylation response protein AidB-like acyl-CoA dehydrogenase